MATVDRISMLPDGILLDIVSRLWADEMVRTSVLSSRWRRLWTASPVLHFTPVFLGRGRVEIPRSLFDYRLLSTLRLSSSSIPSLPSAASGFHGFPCLRTLAFTGVSIADDELDGLLSACPRIEHLSLCSVHDITSLVIHAPALRHLIVYDCLGLDRVKIVCAPELRRLMYCGNLSIFWDFEFGEVASKLEEAALMSSTWCNFGEDLDTFINLVSFISQVRVLYVNSWLFEFTLIRHYAFGDRHQPTFEDLRELHWWPVFQESLGLPLQPWHAEEVSESLHELVFFLRDCPSLEKLCILCTYYMGKAAGVSDLDDCSQSSVEDPLLEFEDDGYMLFQLKTVRMTAFSGKKEEMRLLEFLADKALVLESMAVDYVGEVHPKMAKIRQRLHAFHRASPDARILISKFDEDKVCSKHESMWSEFMV